VGHSTSAFQRFVVFVGTDAEIAMTEIDCFRLVAVGGGDEPGAQSPFDIISLFSRIQMWKSL
jgi:hypothetical protein